MKTQINLASHSQKVKKGINKFTIAAIGVLSMCLFIALGLFVYTYILSSQSTTLDTEIGQLTSAMAKLSGERGKVVTLEDRLTLIDRVISNRVNVNKSLQAVLSIMPDSIGITSLDADRDHISLKLSSSNLADMNSLLQDKIAALATSKNSSLRGVNLDSFSIDTSSSNYVAALNIQLAK